MIKKNILSTLRVQLLCGVAISYLVTNTFANTATPGALVGEEHQVDVRMPPLIINAAGSGAARVFGYVGGNVIDNRSTTHNHYSFHSSLTQEEQEADFINALNYEFGRNGVLRNVPQSVQLYRKLAEQGHNGARHRLSLLLLESPEVTKNISEGLSLLRLACDSDYAKAEYEMSQIYKDGKYGELQDNKQFYTFLLRSGLNGYELARGDFERLLTSSATEDPIFLSDLLEILTTSCPKEGLHPIQPSWRGAEWFTFVFQDLINKVKNPRMFENVLYHSGASFLDVSCLYKQVRAFNTLVGRGAGTAIKLRKRSALKNTFFSSFLII